MPDQLFDSLTDDVTVRPLPATEVRRLGDRRRRRRQAATGVVGLAAVAAIVLPVTLGGGSSDRPVAPATDAPSAPASGAPTASDLLSDADTVYSDGADWFTTDTFAGDGPAFHPCARSDLSGLGATAVYQRDYELRNTGEPTPGTPVRSDFLHESVAQFSSPAAARSAYETIGGWVTACSGRIPGTHSYRTFEPKPIPLDVPGEGTVIGAQYGPPPKSIDPYGDSAYIAETGLVVSGDRILVLGSQIVGQDYDFVQGTPVERMLPIAAELLQAD